MELRTVPINNIFLFLSTSDEQCIPIFRLLLWRVSVGMEIFWTHIPASLHLSVPKGLTVDASDPIKIKHVSWWNKRNRHKGDAGPYTRRGPNSR